MLPVNLRNQAPVPLSIFRSNSKFNENSENALVSNILDRSQRYFAHVTIVTLSCRVQNIVVIGRVYFTLECFEFSSNFEFDRNMLSGTGAWSPYIHHIAVSSLNCLGTSQKRISHDMIKNLSILFFSIIYHNIQWFYAMIMPAAENIKKGDFHCHPHLLQCICETLLWPLSTSGIYICHLEMMVITFVCNISRIVRRILK